jgi:tight adherence protein B
MQSAIVPLIYVLAFIAMVAVVQGVASVLFASRDRAERTNRRLTMLSSGLSTSEVYASLVRQPSSAAGRNVFLLRLYDRFAIYCRQAGLEKSPLQFLSCITIASIGLWFLSFMVFRGGNFASFFLNATLALPASVAVCGSLSWMWVLRRRAKRLKLIEEQMPLALDVVNRAIRAGHPVVSAVAFAGE